MHLSIFADLSLLIALATAVALVMRLIHQPLIIGHILTGILVGPLVFHLIKSPDTIDVFSNIGVALLLFIIGLGLNPKVIKEVGKIAAFAGLLQVSFISFLGWVMGLLLGLTSTKALYLGVALSFSSTIIILKLLSDKKEQGRLYGKVAIGVLLIQDIVATIALLFASSSTADHGFSLSQLGWLLTKGVIIVVPLFFVAYVILPRLHKLIAGSSEFLFLFAIGWGFGCAALFESAGFSLEIGALLAGVALASLPYAQEISARLRPLRDFFIIVFFISLGSRLAFDHLSALLPTIILGSLLVIVVKPVIVLVIMGLFGYTKRTSFKAAMALGQVSEFSLVFIILGNRAGVIDNNLAAAITLIALITIAASSYMILYADQLFVIFEEHLTMFEKRKDHFERESRHHFDLVLLGYQKGGHEFLKVFLSLKKSYVVIDYDPEVIDNLEHQKANFLYGDALDVELLEEAGLDHSRLIVSTISDPETNLYLVKLITRINPRAVLILHAETVAEAAELYELGASYVIMPHYIGNEKIGAFIRRSGLKKSEFRKYRERHLAYLQSHYSLETEL